VTGHINPSFRLENIIQQLKLYTSGLAVSSFFFLNYGLWLFLSQIIGVKECFAIFMFRKVSSTPFSKLIISDIADQGFLTNIIRIAKICESGGFL